jgi:hypothetical protein
MVEHQTCNTVCVQVSVKCKMHRVFCIRYKLGLRNRCTLRVSGKVVNR